MTSAARRARVSSARAARAAVLAGRSKAGFGSALHFGWPPLPPLASLPGIGLHPPDPQGSPTKVQCSSTSTTRPLPPPRLSAPPAAPPPPAPCVLPLLLLPPPPTHRLPRLPRPPGQLLVAPPRALARQHAKAQAARGRAAEHLRPGARGAAGRSAGGGRRSAGRSAAPWRWVQEAGQLQAHPSSALPLQAAGGELPFQRAAQSKLR
jgi:hypothetical protein